MGFNSVRFLIIPSRNGTTTHPGGFHLFAEQYGNGNMEGAPKYTMQIGAGNYSDTTGDAQKYFQVMARMMDKAQAHHLKVIIICAGQPQPGTYKADSLTTLYYPTMASDSADAADYAAYLHAFALVLKNKPALVAYDIFPEPDFMWWYPGAGMKKNKKEICALTTQWYDAIKSADPNHLVTLSGTDIGDVLVWDDGVMKLDFITMHLYPYPDQLIRAGTPTAITKVKDMIAWCGNTIQKPWIIGETGFTSAIEDCLTQLNGLDNLNHVWGTLQDQKDYMHNILPASRDCGAAGFNLWDFQDIHFFCVPIAICDPTCNHCDSYPTSDTLIKGYCGYDLDSTHNGQHPPGSPNTYGTQTFKSYKDIADQIAGQYYGLLRYSDPDAITGLYDTSYDKPAVSVIQGFDTIPTGTCGISANYYNPDQHPANPLDVFGTPLTITGSVSEPSLEPFKNAVVFGQTPVNNGVNGTVFDLHYTYTDDNGNFNIIPYDYDSISLPNSKDIQLLWVSGLAGNVIERNSKPLLPQYEYQRTTDWNPNAKFVTQNESFTLERNILNYQTNINASPPTGTSIFQGYNSINITGNVVVPSGAIVDYKAREVINVGAGFHASSGSEVHIFCTETFSDCPNDFGSYRKPFHPPAVQNEVAKPDKAEMEVHFKKTPSGLAFAIQPNPNSGNFSITVDQANDKQEVRGLLEVFTLIGTKVYSQQVTTQRTDIDFSDLPKGIYYIRLKAEAKTVSKKLIIQ
jgi:hypothetical protein